jgi:NADH-quinone oxidoreductase subunit G
MPEIVIDGRKIEANQGETIIQAAYRNGLQIPHFCWHPELSVSGNCRMCLVETGLQKKLPDGSFEKDSNGNPVISYFPKLQIACSTLAGDGMYVRTVSRQVTDAQEAVMEFLLINHPLDCPICDEAGECKLQDYAFNYSKGESRFIEEKNHKDKRVEWGPNVMYDGERCISCSRCIRYAQEHAKQDILTFVNRGDKVTIKVAKDEVFDNPYSMNVIEICPVGALTSKDFRFKSRVWDMSFNKSICPGCARGCNIDIGVRNNEILRLEPATNIYVNKYWLCDYGRITQYKFVNENRVTEPLIRSGSGQEKTSFEDTFAKIAEGFKKFNSNEIMFLGSAKATTEDNYILAKFAKQIVKTDNIDFFKYIDESFGDEYLRVKDKTPNSAGARESGITGSGSINTGNLIEKIKSGTVKMLYVMEDNLEGKDDLIDVLSQLEFLVVHSSNFTQLAKMADIVLPTSTYAESEGTFINFKDRVQHFTPAVVTSDNLRYMGLKMSRLDKFGSHNDRWANHQMRNCRQSWKMLQSIANLMNAGWKYFKSSDIFDEIANINPKFKGMDYNKLDEYLGLTLGYADKPDPKLVNYVSHYLKPE